MNRSNRDSIKRSTKKLIAELGITLMSKKKYKEDKNFTWYQKPIDKGHSNLIITELFTGKDVFDYTIDEVTSLRDSVGRSFLLGRNENSFMITEKEYLPLQKKVAATFFFHVH